MAASAAVEASDDRLVEATRAGSDEAFEVLFRRYRDRMIAYVRRMIGDGGRAEDIVQEAFMSALRSLRATDREIIFRPWMFQIARNACIDHLRATRRAEEVSIDSDDFRSTDERRLAQSVPGTESSVSRNEDWEHLKRAFGGLPESQREILVLRELGGLSYEEIGGRVGLSRSAVESVLFRARRGIKHEFDEIATGARCRAMRQVMAQVAEGLGGLRDRRKLLGHVRDCTQCRREVAAMGLSGLALAEAGSGRARRAVSRAAALLPFPAFFRHRPDASSGGSIPGEHAHRLLSTLGTAAGPGGEQTASLVAKTAAIVIAAALVGGGVGGVAAKGGIDFGSSGGSKASGGAGRPGADGGAAGPASDATRGGAAVRSKGSRGSAPAGGGPERLRATGGGTGEQSAPGAGLPGAAVPLDGPSAGSVPLPRLRERLNETVGALGGSSGGGGEQQSGVLPDVTLPDGLVPDTDLPKADLPDVGGTVQKVLPKAKLPLPLPDLPTGDGDSPLAGALGQ